MHVVGFSGGLEGTKPAIRPDFMDLRMSPEDQPWHPSLLYWRIAPPQLPTPSQGLCSFLLTASPVCQVNLTCMQGCCAGRRSASGNSFRGGVQCLICEWCWFTVVCVDCSCSLFCCVSAFLGIHMHKLAFQLQCYTHTVPQD